MKSRVGDSGVEILISYRGRYRTKRRGNSDHVLTSLVMFQSFPVGESDH
jgi:hypothetical protein